MSQNPSREAMRAVLACVLGGALAVAAVAGCDGTGGLLTVEHRDGGCEDASDAGDGDAGEMVCAR